MTADATSEFFDFCPSLAFIAAADGTITRSSKALAARFEARLGSSPTLTSLAAPDERETVTAFLQTLAKTDGPASCVFAVPEQAGGQTKVRCEARQGASGSIHGVLELIPTSALGESAQIQLERMLLRSVMDTLDIAIWVVDPTGKFVFQDGTGVKTSGMTPGDLLGSNVFELYPADTLPPVRQAIAGAASHYKTEAHGVHWETWNIPLKNQAGETEYCAGLTLNISAAVKTERELKHQLDTIQEQQRAIQALSAPLIEVWDKVLTVPLIGVMDNDETNKLIERLLAEVSRSGARFTILDLTGVEALDTSIASHILRLLASLNLLGVEGMVTGVSPIVAQTMVGLGVDLGSVGTHRTLRDALRYCMRELYR
ncbi:RsbR, positive regulator of sigma-B [Enhygromyxa salina]|uniref:RsbR, positive regulator of sigma-B n=1 Tax=Enhygromyxa salina TaxID=215803 RepID=A0A0C1ZPI6_9BACT|nr:STAS domain-containing protein [Enhygromyxa salina]KIG12938.1 RsbR, positive regulator of sigma-B [Enhygromyxa salina]